MALKRPIRIAGPEGRTAKAAKKQEDEAALGGMRNPAASVERMAGAGERGSMMAAVLFEVLDRHPEALNPVYNILDGKTSLGFTGALVQEARSALARTVGAQVEEAGSEVKGLRADLFEAVSAFLGDPDGILAEWLRTGAPLGAKLKVEHTGIFPRDVASGRSDPSLLPPTALAEEWENYSSAEENPQE